jgi:glutamate racemase
MTESDQQFPREGRLHLAITDSGMGGLSVCAAIERNIRLSGFKRRVRITYFNVWPEQGKGYNDLPDMPSRARVFDRALERIYQFRPDRILIACNTLSILYDWTAFSRAAAVPVLGIIDAGVDLFHEALSAGPPAGIVLFGTRTTIESGVHRERLLQRGIQDTRIAAVPCHGLAAAIETDPDGPAVADLIAQCAAVAGAAGRAGNRLYAGLCCTHYTYVSGLMRSALERQSGKTVVILDPNERMADCVAAQPGGPRPAAGAGATADPADAGSGAVAVEVISKVELAKNPRQAVAKRLAAVSGVTARALLSYTWQPDLF